MITFKDIKIGHADDAHTGVTVILSEKGVTAGVCVRGAAPGTMETDLLKNEKTVDKINAVTLSGGSAFGLDSCSGVMRYLSEKDCGFDTGLYRVPIVSGAVIYDLKPGGIKFPDASFGYNACKSAIPLSFCNGKIAGIKGGAAGAGKGAVCGRIPGPWTPGKGGIGFSCIESGGLQLAAIAVVNALGDVFDIETNKIVAGAAGKDGKFIDSNRFVLNGGILKMRQQMRGGTNTVIGAIITNAALTKLQCNKLAESAHDGIALSVKPAHTEMDGDTIFALSAGEAEPEMNTLNVMAVEAFRLAVLNAVQRN